MEFRYKDIALVDVDEIEETAERLSDVAEGLYEVAASADLDDMAASLCMPDDPTAAFHAREVWNAKRTEELRHVFVIGIGGSSLGFQAFYDAKHDLTDDHGARRRVHILDTVSPRISDLIHRQVMALRSPKEALFIVISKSGSTPETAFNLEAVYSDMRARFGDSADERFVFVTDEGSFLWEVADFKRITRVAIPKNVGGRYSVFSAAGMLPLLATGFNIEAIAERAREMRDKCISTDLDENPALASAAVIWSHLQAGRNIHNLFAFGPELESLGKWHRQLVGESLGKRFDIEGDEVRVGITPLVSVGTADLHSVGQLYFDGPDDKVTTFLSMDRIDQRKLPEDSSFELVENLAGVGAAGLLDSIQVGVEEAYYEKNLPFMDVRLANIEDIASFMQWKMAETIYLGALMNVNPFDQPGVEAYKENVRNILSEQEE